VGLSVIDLFEKGSLSHDGTKDTGNGVGLPDVSPGFAGGWDVGSVALPNGLDTTPYGMFCHDGYFYLLESAGFKIWRFAIDSAANLTAAGSQTAANMGLQGDRWIPWGNCRYDPSDGTVILFSYQVGAGTYSPCVGKWDCADWPFTAANKKWLSPQVVRYGSYNAGDMITWYYPSLCTATNKLYLCSHGDGQIATIDATDGSILGVYGSATSQGYVYQMLLAGFDDSNKPVASQYIFVGQGDLAVYDDTNPASWIKGDVVLSSSESSATGIPFHGRNQGAGYGERNRMIPLGDDERALVGLPDMAWFSLNRSLVQGEMYLHTYDFTTSEHCHRSVAQAGDRRAIGNANPQYFGYRFIEIAGQPWFVSFNQHNQDIEDENPGADFDNTRGLVFAPLGPGTCTYTIPPEEVPDGTPKELSIGVVAATKNTLFSDSPAKHRFRFKVNSGAWSDWRSGTRQIQALDQVVDGLAAWPAFSAGDTLTIEHSMCSGWPVSFAPTLGNPGGGGDPTPVAVHSADVGPPREVRVRLFYDASPPNAGKVFGRPVSVDAHIIKPESVSAEITS
jgi:hypothetical protein